MSLPFLLAASIAAVAQSGQAPAASESPAPASIQGPSDLRIEPQRGQTQQQEWSDRYTCYDWARNQSGFDPSRSDGGVPAGEITSRRAAYRRAFAACIEGRGYSVREVEPSTPPAGVPPSPRPYAQSQPYVVAHPLDQRELKYHPLTVAVEGGYSVTAGGAAHDLLNGWNGGLGLTWQPIPALPIAFRIDGSYSRFSLAHKGLVAASQTYGTNIDWGHQSLYGGDADGEINLHMGPSMREYFFGGVGWYKERSVYGQTTWERGVFCGPFYCFRGHFPVDSTVAQNTSGWINSWNAGMGFEFALTSPASFFIEARYLRLSPVNTHTAFVPIRFGLRF